MKDISSLGEFGIINSIKQNFVYPNNKDILAPIGDDAFCFKTGKDIFAITKDLLIEDIHFTLNSISPIDLAKKSVEVNISDLAAMGCICPKYIFVGIGLPKKTPIKFIRDFLKGLKESCKKYNVVLAGGDTVGAKNICISVTAVGKAFGKIVKRSTANVGDLIGVTNFFGDSAMGLKILQKYPNNKNFTINQKYLIKKHLCPTAKLLQSKKIAKHISSLTDASDGLDFSIRLLTKDYEKGAEIELTKIPISPQLKSIVKDEKYRLDLALFGGEDYELVFTAHPSKQNLLKKILPEISFIGYVTNSKKVKYLYNAKERNIKNKTFRHF
jgi:thiamine-monophosphate kinase